MYLRVKLNAVDVAGPMGDTHNDALVVWKPSGNLKIFRNP